MCINSVGSYKVVFLHPVLRDTQMVHVLGVRDQRSLSQSVARARQNEDICLHSRIWMFMLRL